MKKRPLTFTTAIAAVAALTALVAVRPAAAAPNPTPQPALTDDPRISNEDPRLAGMASDQTIGDPQNLQQGIRALVIERFFHLSSSLVTDGEFRQFMSDHVNEAVQDETRMTLAARLAEAREYLRQGQTEMFEATLIALILPAAPPASNVAETQMWLEHWQAQQSWIHGNLARAQAVVDAIYQSLQAPVNP